MKKLTLAAGMLIAMLVFSCATGNSPEERRAASAPDLKPAMEAISGGDLLKHINVLASDEYEGRAPGTKGEELTVTYLTDQFARLGLRPGNPDGTFVQNVPLVGFKAEPHALLTSGQNRLELRFPEDYVAVSHRLQPEIKVQDSDVVFVGYGVVAPEYGWDDYKGVEVKGKTIVMLINDPAIPDPNDPAKLDARMFKGTAMTYYGRWTYKYEIAAEKGAAAAIIVHETGPAGYPYEVVSGSWSGENFDIKSEGGSAKRAAVESWITLEKARKLFAIAGKDLDELKKAAIRKDFRPVPLNAKATFTIRNSLREVQSRNVIARLDGSDPKLKDQYVVFTAHWDHLGKDGKLKGDQVFNGALDNASGTAGLLELAKAFAKSNPPPKRTILFLAVTAEEKGLLGAKYYAKNPLYPLTRTVANINMDGLNQWGRTKDIVIVGLGNSTLDDVLKAEAELQGRVVKPDPEPEKGFFYRSDHFEFAKEGVPALYPDSGTEFIGKPERYAQQKRDEYTERDYHKVSDEVKPDWDMAGAVEDLQLLFRVGYRVAQDDKFAEWKPGTEFKSKREEALRSAGQ